MSGCIYHMKYLPFLIFWIAIPTFAQDFKLLHTPVSEGRLAFTATHHDHSDIYVLDFNTKDISPIVKTALSSWSPAWSFDGTSLVFAQGNRWGSNIYTISADGVLVRKLTDDKYANDFPDFSPDGQSIVFCSTKAGIGVNIYKLELSTKKITPLTSDRWRDTHPRWSPRGTEIVYLTDSSWPGWDMSLINLTEKSRKRLTNDSLDYGSPSFNHDGSAIIFSYGNAKNKDLWLFHKGDASPKKLFSREGDDQDAVEITDGKGIFFAGEVNKGSGVYQLFYYNADTKEVVQILSSSASVSQLSWTPLPQYPSGKILARDKLL